MLQGLDLTTIADCARLSWSPQIGDPTIAGWFTVVAYGMCVLLSLLVLSRLGPGREKAFWTLTAITMAFLCVNKQLDLQSLLTAVGRCVSQLQGWYGERRIFQRDFIIVLLISAVFFLGLLVWLMRGLLRKNGLAILGLAVVTAFVAVRAVGFHHFDVLINQRFADMKFNVLFELVGLVLIGTNAICRLKSRYVQKAAAMSPD